MYAGKDPSEMSLTSKLFFSKMIYETPSFNFTELERQNSSEEKSELTQHLYTHATSTGLDSIDHNACYKYAAPTGLWLTRHLLVAIRCEVQDLPLLQNQHLPRGGEVTGSQRIEIDATCDALTDIVPAIPMRRTRLALIVSSRLMPQV